MRMLIRDLRSIAYHHAGMATLVAGRVMFHVDRHTYDKVSGAGSAIYICRLVLSGLRLLNAMIQKFR